MARGRLIDRTLATSRKFLEIPKHSGKLAEFIQLLFPMIVINTDDYGRMHADALTIKLTVLPGSPRPEEDFEKALGVLDGVGLIELYLVESKRYLQVVQFDEHQPGLNKRTAPKIPPPPLKTIDSGKPQEIPGTSGKFPLNRIEPNGTEVNVIEDKSPHNPPEGGRIKQKRAKKAACIYQYSERFFRFWKQYPKHVSKIDAWESWEAILSTADFDEAELLARIEHALLWQIRSNDWTKEGGQFVPMPTTYLNKRRWEDEQVVPFKPKTRAEIDTENSRRMQAEWEKDDLK